MNNEQKKDYAKPEITIVEMDYEGNLLEESCTIMGEDGGCMDWNDSEESEENPSEG